MPQTVLIDLLTVAAVLPLIAFAAFAFAYCETATARRQLSARGKRRAAYLSR